MLEHPDAAAPYTPTFIEAVTEWVAIREAAYWWLDPTSRAKLEGFAYHLMDLADATTAAISCIDEQEQDGGDCGDERASGGHCQPVPARLAMKPRRAVLTVGSRCYPTPSQVDIPDGTDTPPTIPAGLHTPSV